MTFYHQDGNAPNWKWAGQARHYGGNNGRNATSYLMYRDIRDRNQVFSSMMCRYRLNATIGVGSETEIVIGELVSGNYFPMLGSGLPRPGD
ncbi:MAG TPA: hypothetical protein VNY05_13310 [Candidatus Acidoferrales bacterium]|nr:hypothetical protein [Candidatus Acidoferrales bacterium]